MRLKSLKEEDHVKTQRLKKNLMWRQRQRWEGCYHQPQITWDHQKREEGRKDSPWEPAERAQPGWHLGVMTSSLQKRNYINFYCLSHLACSARKPARPWAHMTPVSGTSCIWMRPAVTWMVSGPRHPFPPTTLCILPSLHHYLHISVQGPPPQGGLPSGSISSFHSVFPRGICHSS